jgi:hypothetical protein
MFGFSKIEQTEIKFRLFKFDDWVNAINDEIFAPQEIHKAIACAGNYFMKPCLEPNSSLLFRYKQTFLRNSK